MELPEGVAVIHEDTPIYCIICLTDDSPEWWKCCPDHTTNIANDVLCAACAHERHPDEIEAAPRRSGTVGLTKAQEKAPTDKAFADVRNQAKDIWEKRTPGSEHTKIRRLPPKRQEHND